MLRDMAANGQRAARGGDRAKSHPTTLPELGVSRDQSARWQKLAAVPEDKFERAVAAGNPRHAIGMKTPHVRVSTDSLQRSLRHPGKEFSDVEDEIRTLTAGAAR